MNSRAIRQTIRTAIDTHARQRRQAFIDAGELHVCTGCGCDTDTFLAGYDQCADRRRARELRADPAYRDLLNGRERERRSLRRKAA